VWRLLSRAPLFGLLSEDAQTAENSLGEQAINIALTAVKK